MLITIREGAPHKQAKAIFPNGSCRSFQITALLRESKTPESSPIPPTSPVGTVEAEGLLLVHLYSFSAP